MEPNRTSARVAYSLSHNVLLRLGLCLSRLTFVTLDQIEKSYLQLTHAAIDVG